MSAASGLAFGTLLRQLRKRAGMTQRDLAAALDYSDSLISGLETAQRQPDLDAILPLFVPALGLQDEPSAARRLYEYAAAARGEQPQAVAPTLYAHRNGARAGAPLRLPGLPVELIGRAETVAQLGNRLMGHGGRLLTLVGAPGVGKTTLALAIGERVQHRYDDGGCFVPLAAVNDRDLMAAAILAQIAPGVATDAPPEKLLIEYLRRKRIRLFVLASTIDHYVIRLLNRGEFAQALPLIQEGLQACEARGYMTGVAAYRGHSGLLALLQGDLAQARPLLSQAVDLAAARIHPVILYRTQILLAAVTLYGNEPAEARRLLMDSLETWHNVGDTVQLARSYIYLAETALWEGKIEETAQWLGRAVGYRIQPVRLGGATWDALFVAARLAQARQAYRDAAMLLGLAEETRLRAHVTLVAPVRAQVEAALAAVQAALGLAAFAAAFAAGREMEFGEVYGMILSDA